jgi:hypothetical protein
MMTIGPAMGNNRATLGLGATLLVENSEMPVTREAISVVLRATTTAPKNGPET